MKERCAAPWDAYELEHDGERVTVEPHATGSEEDLAADRADLTARADAMIAHLDAMFRRMNLTEAEQRVLRLRFAGMPEAAQRAIDRAAKKLRHGT